MRERLELLGAHQRQHALGLSETVEASKRETHCGHWIVRVEVQGFNFRVSRLGRCNVGLTFLAFQIG